MIAVTYSAFIVYYQSIQLLPIIFLYFLVASSLLSFLFYGIDKIAAIKNWRRTPEKYFHLLALCSGWPGSILGQLLFHHKTTKASFRAWFYLMSLLNMSIVLLYFFY
ncbi:DUF1294 domain-containing protein [Psychromonas sp. RZ22]|nr:DUF1294 domain-containing protein [Psychromonas sp. RZ22]